MDVPIPGALARAVNRGHRLDGTAFDPATPFGPPHGRYRTVHYGVMLPGLPDPVRFLNLIAVIGQPRIDLWRNDYLVTTTPQDTATLLTATSTASSLAGYSVERDCELRPDGSLLRFDEDVVLEGSYPQFRVRRETGELRFDLALSATSTVTHFVRLAGRLYDHWSLLCRVTGTVAVHGEVTPVQCLGNLEYARGAAIALPFRFFTYHVVDIDDRTQVLFCQVLGPFGSVVQREVYVRSVDEPSRVHRRCRFEVHSYEPAPRRTPDGRDMLLPLTFSWSVADAGGGELVSIRGAAAGDWAYGLAAGYAGSFDYEGTFRGREIGGTAYLEYIDAR